MKIKLDMIQPSKNIHKIQEVLINSEEILKYTTVKNIRFKKFLIKGQ